VLVVVLVESVAPVGHCFCCLVCWMCLETSYYSCSNWLSLWHSCNWYCKLALLLTFLSWWSLAVDVHVLVCVNRFLESWIAFQMLRSLDYSAGKSIWVLIDMVESTGSWPGGYLCMYIECYLILFLYIHGSVHRESNLVIVQQDATYSVYYISLGSSTCFGCWHPSSGAGTTVITASGID